MLDELWGGTNATTKRTFAETHNSKKAGTTARQLLPLLHQQDRRGRAQGAKQSDFPLARGGAEGRERKRGLEQRSLSSFLLFVRELNFSLSLFMSYILARALRSVPKHDGLVVSRREDFAPGLRDEHGVLELGGPASVPSDCGPVVAPRRVLPRPEVDHGLHGEDVASLHDALGLVLGVVGNLQELTKIRRQDKTRHDLCVS